MVLLTANTNDDGTVIVHRHRFDRLAWRKIKKDHPVWTVYQEVENKLRSTARNAKEARYGANLLYHFTSRMITSRGDPPDTIPDPRTISGTQSDLVHAAVAWEDMIRHSVWSPEYLRDVRRALSNALLQFGEPLAHLVNPSLHKGSLCLHVERSHHTTFTLHSCIPLRWRRIAPQPPEYGLLLRIGERMTTIVSSVSQIHLQCILLLFDRVLHTLPGIVWKGDRWNTLQDMSAMDWLNRYALTFPRTDKNNDAVTPRLISYDLFKRHIRYISQFHHRILHPEATCVIPVPVAHRITHQQPSTASSSQSSFGSSSDEITEDEIHTQADRQELLRYLGELRQRFCRDPPTALERAERVYAFTPKEVRRLVEMACTTNEQLVCMLFLTTGMRLGGVARLQLVGPPPRTAEEVPAELVTTEKNNKMRTIRPTPCCRVLLARWYTQGRSTHPKHTHSSFVFPSLVGDEDRNVPPRHIWHVCRGLFARAGIQGPHAHPHSFRHTVVHPVCIRWSNRRCTVGISSSSQGPVLKPFPSGLGTRVRRSPPVSMGVYPTTP